MRTRLGRTGNLVASAGVSIFAISAAAIASLILGVALIIGASTAADMESRAATATAQAREVGLQSGALLQALTNAETAQRGYLLTGEHRYLRPYEGAGERARAALNALARTQSQRVEDIDRLTELTDRRLQIIDTTLELARTGRRDQALAILGDGAAVMTELRTRLGELLESADRREQAIRAEQRRLDEHGRWLQMGLSVLMLAALLIAAISLILERVTARRAARVRAGLTEELVVARNIAQDANEAKTRFLATASHDMRQPLHAMALYISTLEPRVESTQAREILRNMDGAVRTMTRLFAALLDLARLEAGALTPEPTNFALGPLLQDVADYSADPKTGARVRVVDPDVEVHSDPDLLEVILRNLTVNAVKHSKGAVLLGCRRVGGQVRIEVHDNGQGVPEDQVRRLTTEFAQGRQVGSTERTGLGLTIVQRMAKLLGHPLSVQTEAGRGSVFTVTVPRA